MRLKLSVLIAVLGAVLPVASPAAAQAGYEDDYSSTMTARDVTSAEGQATADAHADAATGALSVSASTVADSPLPVHFGAIFFGSFYPTEPGYGWGTSMAGSGAHVSRTFEVTPGTYRVRVTLSGAAAAATARDTKAWAQSRAELHIAPDLGSDLVRGHIGEQVIRIGTRGIGIEDNVTSSRTLACVPTEGDCSVADTFVLEATVTAEETIRVSVGLTTGAQSSRGAAESWATATAGPVTITRVN